MSVLPSYAVDFRGRPACPCLAEWLPWFERIAVLRGIVRESIDVAQLIGGAAESAGTHTEGGAADLWQHTWETQELARTMGAAAFVRLPPAFDPHTHLVLVGCPHTGPARYQIGALADGFNGLGAGGRGVAAAAVEPGDGGAVLHRSGDRRAVASRGLGLCGGG